MTRRTSLNYIGRPVLLVGLTFAVPAMQWLVNEVSEISQFGGVMVGAIITLAIYFWWRGRYPGAFLPASRAWKAFCGLAGAAAFVLLIHNIQEQPVSRITGTARSPIEVFNVIALFAVAEELVFRGVMWPVIEGLSKKGNRGATALVGTSLLFGISHLGYWAQSTWPLPPEAYIHSLSMILAGICFGTLRLASGSPGAPAAVHMLANGVILLTQQ